MPMTFMGTRMAQEWYDLYIWENFFKTFPIATFIELGTGHGGFSIFLALQCYQRNIQFHTFENNTSLNVNDRLPALLNMGKACHVIDIFRDDEKTSVAQVVAESPRPIAMFFDDGDKPREWRTFGPLTIPGDYLIVHDWDTEFSTNDIGGIKVERILTELSDKRTTGWKSMWFKRIP